MCLLPFHVKVSLLARTSVFTSLGLWQSSNSLFSSHWYLLCLRCPHLLHLADDLRPALLLFMTKFYCFFLHVTFQIYFLLTTSVNKIFFPRSLDRLSLSLIPNIIFYNNNQIISWLSFFHHWPYPLILFWCNYWLLIWTLPLLFAFLLSFLSYFFHIPTLVSHACFLLFYFSLFYSTTYA